MKRETKNNERISNMRIWDAYLVHNINYVLYSSKRNVQELININDLRSPTIIIQLYMIQ